jgi:hypothetical protein
MPLASVWKRKHTVQCGSASSERNVVHVMYTWDRMGWPNEVPDEPLCQWWVQWSEKVGGPINGQVTAFVRPYSTHWITCAHCATLQFSSLLSLKYVGAS